MIHFRSIFLAAAVVCTAVATSTLADPVSFDTSDGVRVILAPLLNKAGFSTVAIDQRSGGNLWDDVNRAAAEEKNGANFAAAIPDIEAAILYGSKQHSGPLIVWGSSYSAALVFIGAAHHPEVKALLAFSPAEYVEGYLIRKEAAKLSIPVFITSAPDAGEILSGRTLANATRDHLAVQYIRRAWISDASPR